MLHLRLGVFAVGPLDLLAVPQQLRYCPPQADGEEPQQLFLYDTGVQQCGVQGAVHRTFVYQLSSTEPAQLVVDLADVFGEIEPDAAGFQFPI